VLYAVATVLAVGLQMPVGRLVAAVAPARRGQVAAGLLLAVACAALAAAAHSRGPLTIGLLTIGLLAAAVAVLTLGELFAVAAAWTLSYAAAPADRRAEYLSAFSLGRSVARYLIGPVAVTGLLAAAGAGVWLILGGVFALAACLAPVASAGQQ